jgi:ribosomal protein S18 acetylase RimI-like enzyme
MIAALPGQETLISCWSTLAHLSPGARLVPSSAAVAAVFPSWAPLNNAILQTAREGAATATSSELAEVYDNAGVDSWALWLPSCATDLDAPDEVQAIGALKRGTTTLVMQASLDRAFPQHVSIVRASIAAAIRATDEAVPTSELGKPNAVPGLAAWVMVQERVAVAGAWSFLHGQDCGIYAVGTVPSWRRRGGARSLVEHVLGDAARRGAQTATLQSTSMAQRLYASLGFAPVGRYEEWIAQ